MYMFMKKGIKLGLFFCCFYFVCVFVGGIGPHMVVLRVFTSALCSGVNPGGLGGTIGVSGDQSWVDHLQGKHSAY